MNNKMKKRGNILTENIIFIVLNLVFLTILVIFLFAKVESSAVLEEKYAKQIALMLDAAEPGMEIHLNMEDAISDAKDNGWEGNIVTKDGNIIRVQLREKGGFEYSFFNDIEVAPYPDTTNDKEDKEYVFVIEGKNEK